MSLNGDELNKGDFVIDATNGRVHKWDKDNEVQKVEIVNGTPQKWLDKSNVLAVGGIVIAVIIALITWLYFSNKGS